MLTLYKLSIVLTLAGHGADLASTQHCLGRGVCREMNPWLGRYEQPATFGAVKMGTAGGGLLLTHRLHEKHPKLAILANFVVAGAYAGIAIHNARVGAER